MGMFLLQFTCLIIQMILKYTYDLPSVIFCAALVPTILIVVAPPGIRNAASQYV